MVEQLFLEAMQASLRNEHVNWNKEINIKEWLVLFKMAEVHKVLPMIYEAVYDCPAAKMTPDGFLAPYKSATMHAVTVQTMKTMEFLDLYRFLAERGIRPLVVKGLICRGLYPNPDQRMSSDEDMVIEAGTFARVDEAFREYGMVYSEPEMDVQKAYEVPYGKKQSLIYIELHKQLFPPDSKAYGELNRFFENVFANRTTETYEGVDVDTMGYTEHLFYLICHAFKHFLHSGFGIRQVCDIILFANAYGDQIDWQLVLDQCRQIHADFFAAALFKIGENFLVFDRKKACYPKEWQKIRVDEMPLLKDLLSSGIYGQADMSRKHSSNITLNAVAADKKKSAGARKNAGAAKGAGGKKNAGAANGAGGMKSAGAKKRRFMRFGAIGNLLKTVFPPVSSMEGRYRYLEKFPFLLPIAWMQRILQYRKETKGNSAGNNAKESMRIGEERVELMRKYKIIQ